MFEITLFFKFLIGHAVSDFVLQQEAMVSGKNRHHPIHAKTGKNFPAWYYWLTAHALIHGGAVYIITASPLLAIIETACHWVLDFLKCEEKINFHQDQALHLLCKIAYCVYLAN